MNLMFGINETTGLKLKSKLFLNLLYNNNTTMKLFDVYPLNDITITKAQGSYVWDENGVQYLDLYGGHAVISIGHTHPHWVKRIEDQLNKIAFYSNSVHIPIQQELADKLGKISGKEEYQLFLVNSGAEANENALKLASFHKGKKKIVAFNKSFHGRTSLAVAATDNQKLLHLLMKHRTYDFLAFNDENALKNYFDKNGNDVCAVIVEGIQGVGGINVAIESFLKLIRHLCDEYNAFLLPMKCSVVMAEAENFLVGSCRCKCRYLYHGKRHGQWLSCWRNFNCTLH